MKQDNNNQDISLQKDYIAWIGELKKRYRATQIKAAISVNSTIIEFYWNLGKDISEKYCGTKIYGSGFFNRLSQDLKQAIPESHGFSTQNLRYCQNFYEFYHAFPNFQQLVGELISVPWGHHTTIIDKCKGNREKALFYVRRTIQNGWSRSVLLNWLSTDLYEREGKGQTNFELTMPSDDCDLAEQLIKDPQVLDYRRNTPKQNSKRQLWQTSSERSCRLDGLSHLSARNIQWKSAARQRTSTFSFTSFLSTATW